MYRTFNMGVGLVLICSESESAAVQQVFETFPDFHLHALGEVIPSKENTVRLV
jgi:phosphoribosylaminoimidazole (AIR) synthetase